MAILHGDKISEISEQTEPEVGESLNQKWVKSWYRALGQKSNQVAAWLITFLVNLLDKRMALLKTIPISKSIAII